MGTKLNTMSSMFWQFYILTVTTNTELTFNKPQVSRQNVQCPNCNKIAVIGSRLEKHALQQLLLHVQLLIISVYTDMFE